MLQTLENCSALESQYIHGVAHYIHNGSNQSFTSDIIHNNTISVFVLILYSNDIVEVNISSSNEMGDTYQGNITIGKFC